MSERIVHRTRSVQKRESNRIPDEKYQRETLDYLLFSSGNVNEGRNDSKPNTLGNESRSLLDQQYLQQSQGFGEDTDVYLPSKKYTPSNPSAYGTALLLQKESINHLLTWGHRKQLKLQKMKQD